MPKSMFFFKHSKLSDFSETREFRVKTTYFPLLFPCRPMVALTHAVNDRLSFNEIDKVIYLSSVKVISTSVETSLHS